MKTYSTYQEAKIANPESEIYLCDRFIAEKDIIASHHTYEYRGLIRCNPSDYCMTVEQFLSDGYKFVEGDSIIDHDGCPYISLTRAGCEVENEKSTNDNKRYILRAAALDLADIAKQNVERHSKQISETAREVFSGSKNRTKVEFVKVNGNHDGGAFLECAKDYSDGVIFTTMGSNKQLTVNSIDELLDRYKCHNLYRYIETPITEREAFIEAMHEIASEGCCYISFSDLVEKIADSGKFKLVN